MAEFKRSIVTIQKIKDSLEEHTSRDEAAMDEITAELYDLDKNGQPLMMLGEARTKVKNHYDSLNASKFNPFSYQKKAVRDFIYTFKRKGILSDQVGMGKTIEAGMILSELACRQELKSLLILVPGATMVYKWEKELSSKFGFRNFFEDVTIDGEIIKQKDFPRIITVNDKEDMNVLLFDALDTLDQDTDLFSGANLNDMIQDVFDACYEKVIDSCTTEIESVEVDITAKYGIQLFKIVVPALVKAICEQLVKHPKWPAELKKAEYIKYLPTYEKYVAWEKKNPVDVDSVYTLISDYYAGESGDSLKEKCLSRQILRNSILSQFNFCKAEYGEIVKERVKNKVDNSKMDVTSKRVLLASIAEQIRNTFAVMIVGNEKVDGKYWLNEMLFEYKDPALQYLYGPESFYTYFDLLSDIQFSTLIVDEVHNYIDVVSKNPANYDDEVCKNYHMFELFRRSKNIGDGYDQYLVRRSCSFAKLLTLSNHANQKMFMTATPIKSDMIDFYLLNLLRGKDNHLDFSLDRINKDGPQILDYNALKVNAAKILEAATENVEAGRSLTRANFNYITKKDLVCSVISELRHKFYQEKWDDIKEDLDVRTRTLLGDFIIFRVNHFAEIRDWNKALDAYKKETHANWGSRIDNMLEDAFGDEAIADVVYTIANGERAYFEEKFVTYDADDNERKHPIPIKTIQQLVASDAGMDEWRKKYSSLGIRTTRHQTDNIEEPWLSLLKPEFQSNYGANGDLRKMPTWSCRNSTVFTICREDRYFDYVACLNMHNLIAVLGGENTIAAKAKTTEELLQLDPYEIGEGEEKRTIVPPKGWAAAEREMKETIDALDEAFPNNQDSEEYLIRKDAAINAYKKKIADFLYVNVIDDGMAGYCKTNYATQKGLPDYLVARMHILIELMQGSIESQDPAEKGKNFGFEKVPLKEGGKVTEKKTKVLVFAREGVNEKLYKCLLEEIEIAKTKKENMDEVKRYREKRGHDPFTAEEWLISTDIGDLQKNGINVLVIVPPNKYEEGVDLQKATHLVNFDILHSPLAMEQRIGRIDRVRPENKEGDRNIFIYSFTPLNDWSGFSTSFLAYYLKLFNRWNGDTTGIVSFPVSEKENSSTFDSIVREMEEAYKILSDHAEGEAIVKAYSAIKRKLAEVTERVKPYSIKAENESGKKSKLRQAVEDIRGIIENVYYRYDDKGKRYIESVYGPADITNLTKLDTHIFRQANQLKAHMDALFGGVAKTLYDTEHDRTCLESLADIMKELNIDNDPMLAQKIDEVWDRDRIYNDLRFIYYQHFFADITCKYTRMLETYKDEHTKDVVIPFKNKRSIKDPTMLFKEESNGADTRTLLNAWEAYWSGVTLQKEAKPDRMEYVKIEDEDESGFGRGDTELPKDEQYDLVLEQQWTGPNNNLMKGTDKENFHYQLASNKTFNGNAKGVTVFTIYNRIINKYLYPLLAMYVYLCRQVKNRLTSMARIIEKGAVDELKAMLAERLQGFNDAVDKLKENGGRQV